MSRVHQKVRHKIKRDDFNLIHGDVLNGLRSLPSESVHCCITSPPYYSLRDYGTPGQIGLERTPQEYLCKMVAVFEEVRRVLRRDGQLWLNLGDSFWGGKGQSSQAWSTAHQERHTLQKSYHQIAGKGQTRPTDGKHSTLKPKDLMMMPARIALALQDAGWWIRSEIVWQKMSPMPESVTDRPTCAHEKIFLMSRSSTYFYDAEAVREPAGPFHAGGKNNAMDNPKTPTTHKKQDALGKPTYTGFNDRWKDAPISGRNLRNVWTLPPSPYPDAHFATFPPSLPKRCILAGTSERGCCPTCGKCWRRVVEKSRTFESGSGKSGNAPTGKHGKGLQGGGETLDIRCGPCVTTETTGWQPACTCPEHQPVPCTVLDCFLGSGTTLMVAAQLGRRGVGIELNAEYLEMSRKRIYAACEQEVMVF